VGGLEWPGIEDGLLAFGRPIEGVSYFLREREGRWRRAPKQEARGAHRAIGAWERGALMAAMK